MLWKGSHFFGLVTRLECSNTEKIASPITDILVKTDYPAFLYDRILLAPPPRPQLPKYDRPLKRLRGMLSNKERSQKPG